jgi:hypothetical protein
MEHFAPSPAATFSILKKLDHCFASLLHGEDIDTKETLPGFENGLRGGMTTTDMVRCKGIVEQTRVNIVKVMSKEPELEEEDQETDTDTDMGTITDDSGAGIRSWGVDDDDDEDDINMDVARVYENTLVQLGERMQGSLGLPG